MPLTLAWGKKALGQHRLAKGESIFRRFPTHTHTKNFWRRVCLWTSSFLQSLNHYGSLSFFIDSLPLYDRYNSFLKYHFEFLYSAAWRESWRTLRQILSQSTSDIQLGIRASIFRFVLLIVIELLCWGRYPPEQTRVFYTSYCCLNFRSSFVSLPSPTLTSTKCAKLFHIPCYKHTSFQNYELPSPSSTCGHHYPAIPLFSACFLWCWFSTSPIVALVLIWLNEAK